MESSVPSRLAASNKIAIVRIRSLGDCVLSTPAIHLLKQRRPKLEIAVVVEPAWRAVYEGNPDISAILPPTNTALWDFGAEFCLDFHGGSRAARLAFFSGAKHRAGFAHATLRSAYNIRIPTAQQILGTQRRVHTAEHMASAMFYLGVPECDVPRARLFTDDRSTSRGPYAIIHPLASKPEKTWQAAGFLRVAEYLRDHAGIEAVFIASEGQDLSAFAGWRTITGAPLPDIKALIAGATLFIGNDSGPAHIAAAFGVPPVVLFGPSNPAIWGPWGTRGEVIQAEGLIDSITVAQVTKAVDRLMVAA